MATMTSYTPGSFCWNELVTTDSASAKSFYSSLFGWNATDQEFAPGNYYTTLDIGGKAVCALYGMDAAQRERGVSPHWNLYISVENVDDSSAKAASLGATVVLPPFDVMEVGRMSIIQDPTGAMVCLWQPKQHFGAALIGENGAFCWWELQTNDMDKAKAFYTSLFGWTAGGNPEYVEWVHNGVSMGGMLKIQPEWGAVPPNWQSYVMVPSVDDTAAKAATLGGSIMAPPTDIPGMGRFAVLVDPQGAVFSVYTRS
jgi:predicted enzyme related to lactoylglutathione lyase